MPDTPRRRPRADDSARRAVAAVDRDARTLLLARLTRYFGDLDLAEDAMQEALAQALVTWPTSGVPTSPAAWLTTTAKRKGLDVVRREKMLADKLARLQLAAEREHRSDHHADPADLAEQPPLSDERLGMFFACTHPVLSAEDRIALTLRFVAGLTTVEVAHALLIPTATMQQRIVRAKRRIATLGVPFTAPAPGDLPARAPGVLRVIYLLYAEGFARSAGPAHVRDDLTAEAVRLARLLHRLLPRAETVGLLALLLLTEARRPARLGADSRPVPLSEQDRSRWDAALRAEGLHLAERAAGSPGAGPYAIQAAIAAVHAEADDADGTDWSQIAVLYRMLQAVDPGPVVELGRAVAVGRALGPSHGLRLLDDLASNTAMIRYRPFHIARALTLVELGDAAAAAHAYREALALPGNRAEDDYLAASLADVEQR
ncbi:RNA polymerase sigma factor [Gordonia sp. (in: high G+C Gram-positive bacteria)]|uniref:RNA polymerase sigma factor n=1 Tax=Gordonia sp. (in: high G+C Gram-positive bacteria) TaxID=84139 RepID=UPI003C77F0B9